MRRGVPLALSEIELALAARAGLTRRGFLLAATATVGTIGAGAYAWNRYTQLLDSTEGSGSPGLIEGTPLALTPSGLLLDTDFPDPFTRGIFLGYLRFRSRRRTATPADSTKTRAAVTTPDCVSRSRRCSCPRAD